MNTQSYFRSLSRELLSLKDRVRNFIEGAHWLTDGEWKESVIRYFLRRNLPGTIKVGRGFIIEGSNKSHQIDILIYDDSKPVLFRDGDLVFVTPDVVNGIIEVKSKLNAHLYEEALIKLSADAKLMRSRGSINKFSALFAFEIENNDSNIYLEILAKVVNQPRKLIDFATLGISKFIKYWEFDPKDHRKLYHNWHSYQLDEMAPGYFIHNVVDALNPDSVFQNNEVWFPLQGKEPYKDGTIKANWHSEGG